VSECQICNVGGTEFFRIRLVTSTLPGENETQASGFEQNKDNLTVLTCANDADTQVFKLLFEI
jgi:hypothetical protein